MAFVELLLTSDRRSFKLSASRTMPDAGSLMLILVIVIVLAGHLGVVVVAYLPPQNPPWPPTYNFLDSLIGMQCNRIPIRLSRKL